jgi:N,N'-diacetyllegionaminate synthase
VTQKMKLIKIANKTIGEKRPTFIIAEAGVNHNGKLEQAKRLVDIAVRSGADAVKFQTFKAEEIVTKYADMAEYQIKNLGRKKSQLDMLKDLELSYEEFKKLKQYCDRKKIIFLSTPHTFDAIDFLEPLVPAYKFGSGDITNFPALSYASKKGKPIILSTGMSTMKEVKDAIKVIKAEGNKKIIVLHCTTNYPCPLEEVNLRAMVTMHVELDCLVGFSDHTSSIMVPALAVGLGATVIEKHFTLDKNLPGPDHLASLEPNEFKKMIQKIRETEKVLGSYEKKPVKSEKKILKYSRKSIVARVDIIKGTLINEKMVVIKRPGTGLSPIFYDKILGKKAKDNIKKDTIIEKNMIGD